MTDVLKAFAAAQESYRAALPAKWDARIAAAAACEDGRIAAATEAVSAGSFAACLRALQSAAGECGAGDVVITNDVYHGSNHPTEVTAATPIVEGGRVRGWAMLRTELADIGGWELGAYSPRALDIWSEGARIVPAKVFRNGAPRREVLDMLQLNSRTPRLNLACVTSLARTALSLAGSLAPLASTLGALADQSEQRAASALARVERGEGKAEVPQAGPLRLRITPHGARLSISFPELPAASAAPLNATRAMTLDSIVAGITATLRVDPAAAVALHRLIDLEVAEDRLLSAARRRPAGWARAITGRAVFQATCDALGASGDAGWPARDPHFDPVSGRLSEARRSTIETLERGM